MTVFGFFLTLHIISGIICLLAGLLAAFSKKRRGRHTVLGELYHGSYVVVFVTALITSVMHWQESSYLFFIALFSYSLALFGYMARKRRVRNWLPKHIGGMLGSYIGIVTAVIVVNIPAVPVVNEWPALAFWLLPTVIGTPIIIAVNSRFQKRSVQLQK